MSFGRDETVKGEAGEGGVRGGYRVDCPGSFFADVIRLSPGYKEGGFERDTDFP